MNKINSILIEIYKKIWQIVYKSGNFVFQPRKKVLTLSDTHKKKWTARKVTWTKEQWKRSVLFQFPMLSNVESLFNLLSKKEFISRQYSYHILPINKYFPLKPAKLKKNLPGYEIFVIHQINYNQFYKFFQNHTSILSIKKSKITM